MMKLAVSYILLLAAILARGQALPEHPQQCGLPAVDFAIHKVAEEWKDGYNDRNPDRVAALYAQDATYLTQHFFTGIVYGRPAIKAYVKLGTSAEYRIDSITVLSSGCSMDFAYAITRYDAINGDQKVFGVNLVVLKKIKHKWLIVAHEAAVPDPQTAIRNLEISPEGPSRH